MTSIIDLQSGQWIDLGGKHEPPDHDLASDTLRRCATTWLSLAASARDAGQERVALHHELKASEYLERARRIEREEARKDNANQFLSVLGMKLS
jgi:hypothetical protein